MPLHFRSASFVPSVLLAVIVTLVFLMFPGELRANTHRIHTHDLRLVKKALSISKLSDSLPSPARVQLRAM